MIDEPSETAAWVQGLRQGNRDALAELFNYYRLRLERMARLWLDARLTARVDPSDVVQEAYLDAARQVQAYVREPKVAVYVWLRGLVWERLVNIQRQHLGAQRRSVVRELPLPAESSALLAQQLLSRGPSPSQALVQEEMRQRLQRALRRLRGIDREVILMRHFEGMSNSEVAQALRLTDSAATMRYGRALVRLKEILVGNLSSGELT